MNRRFVLLVLTLAGLAAGPARAQQPTPAEFIDGCLAALLDVPPASLPTRHVFRLVRPGDTTARVDVELAGARLVHLSCPGYGVDPDPATGAPRLSTPDGSAGRLLTYSEIANLRSFLSLDPYWVFRRIGAEIDAYAFTPDEAGGVMIVRRESRVPLADPGEKVYGHFREEAVIGLAGQDLVSYSVMALDEDRIAVRDILNLYEYERTRGPAWVRVTQGSNFSAAGPRVYRVNY